MSAPGPAAEPQAAAGAASGPGGAAGAGVARSALWRALEVGGTELISFGFFVLMTRLLAPEQFGQVALATAIVILAQSLLQQGLPDAMVQRARLDDAQVSSAFGASLLLAALLTLGCLLLAWPLALALQRPQLAGLLCAMAPMLLLQGIAAPLHALRRRTLDFRSIALRTLAGTAVGGMLAVALAFNGAGVWALVAQQWTVAIVGLLVLLATSPDRPRSLRIARAALAPLAAVARPIMAGHFLSNAARRLDAVVLGIFLGDHEVGLYFLVARLVASVTMLTQNSIGEIGLVVLSRMQHDRARHREAVRNALRYTAFACTALQGMLAVAADTLVPTLFGAAWHDAAQPLTIIAVAASFAALAATSSSILLSGGAARLAGTITAATSLATLLAIVIGARWGLVPMALSIAAAQLLTMLPALQQVGARFAIGSATLLRDIAPFYLAFAVGLAADRAIAAAGSLATAVAGAAVFVLVVTAVGASLLRRDLVMLRRGRIPTTTSEDR